jgi:hypothetical protein
LGLLELILDELLGTTWYRLALLGNKGHPLLLLPGATRYLEALPRYRSSVPAGTTW